MKNILGLDPGINGAIALRSIDGDEIEVFDMPTHSITVNKKKKKQIEGRSNGERGLWSRALPSFGLGTEKRE